MGQWTLTYNDLAVSTNLLYLLAYCLTKLGKACTVGSVSICRRLSLSMYLKVAFTLHAETQLSYPTAHVLYFCHIFFHVDPMHSAFESEDKSTPANRFGPKMFDCVENAMSRSVLHIYYSDSRLCRQVGS